MNNVKWFCPCCKKEMDFKLAIKRADPFNADGHYWICGRASCGRLHDRDITKSKNRLINITRFADKIKGKELS